MQAITKQIQSGEYISMSALEILSIPDISIIDCDSEQSAIDKNARMISQSMGSIFDIYKTQSSISKCEVSLELMWVSEPQKNQTYDARIRLVLLFRAISEKKELSESVVIRTASPIVNALEIGRYTFQEVTIESVNSILRQQELESKQAIVREVRSEALPLPVMPQCLYYDCFNVESPSLELLANTLIKSPNSIVSFHLMPTTYSGKEKDYISMSCQALSMLENGLHDPSFGVIPVVAAQKCIDTYNYYHINDSRPLFECCVYVLSNHQYVNTVVSSVRTLLSGNNQTATKVVSLDHISSSELEKNYLFAPWVMEEQILLHSKQFGDDINRLPHIITAEESTSLFSLPIGSGKIGAGFTVDHSVKQGKEYYSTLIDSDGKGSIVVGKLKSSSGQHTISFSLNDLTKHMLVVGTPGSGKTTFSVGLLDRLWKQGIPFLVIEPAKNEYRALIKSIPDLQVFTPGKNLISPFVLNPFLPPENVRLEAYKSVLKTAFEAGVTMTSPLDRIFEETINNCYSDFGWLDTYTSKNRGRVFGIADFIDCFQKTEDDIGYVGEASNIAKAGVVRLKGLVNLFDTYKSIPIADLLNKPTVIELAAIENQDEKALIISLLLLSIMSYINANYEGDSSLRNVILIEEAHVLLDAQSHSGEGGANPSSIAQNLVKRMLAEIRAYGVGLIIADQSPRKVTSDVVALTDIKLAFRLVESEDKRMLSDSINLSDAQSMRLSRLKPGEAFLFFNKLEDAEEIILQNYRLDNKIDITISDNEVAKLSTYWESHGQLQKPYPECDLCRYCVNKCCYERRILAKEISRRIYVHYFKTIADGKIPRQAVPRVAEILKAISEKTDISNENRQFAAALYERSFSGKGGRATLEAVFRQINAVSLKESNGEKVTPELVVCIKLHLFRRIQYESRIHVKPSEIRNSLSL